MAGLWPQLDGTVLAPAGAAALGAFSEADGEELATATKSVYYVAQKAYCPQGSLRAQVVYPVSE